LLTDCHIYRYEEEKNRRISMSDISRRNKDGGRRVGDWRTMEDTRRDEVGGTELVDGNAKREDKRIKVDHLRVEGKIRKRVSNPIGLILTQQILRIKNTKPLHNRINKRISVSFFKGASNIIYEEDMINVSYPTSLS
jgi:hypothetical protein